MARKGSLNAGDRVAYSAKWLRSTGQVAGEAGQRRGVVASRHRTGDLVYVRWDCDVASGYADIRAVYGDDPEYVQHVIDHGVLVAEANLARVGPNRDFCNV